MRPVLETERLILRLPSTDDLPAILRYVNDNASHLAPWEPAWPPGYRSAEFWVERIGRIAGDFERGVSVRLYLFDRAAPERVVGTASLTQIVRAPFDACYLGYAIGAADEGKGLMAEALRRVIAYAFDELRLHRIMANYMPHNLRSGGLLRRLGFVVEGYARDYLRIGGRWEDHVLTALTHPDWREA